MLYWLLASNILLMSVGQILFKKSSIFINLHPDLSIIYRYLYNYWFFLGITSFGIATFVWVKILSMAKLSSVYPMQSLAYIVVAFLSYYLFAEKVSFVNSIGSVFSLSGKIKKADSLKTVSFF